MIARIRIMTGIFVFILIILTGYLRDAYLFDLSEKSTWIHSRNHEELYEMPASLSNLKSGLIANPKWISSLVFTIVYTGLSVLCIWFLFFKPLNLLLTLYAHVFLFFAAGILVLSGLLFHSFRHFYLMAEYIKNLVQSPLLTLILITGFFLERNT